MFDSFPILLALIPFTLYAIILAMINLGRRPWLLSGAKDIAAMGLGMAGFVLIGPLEYFVPAAAMEVYQHYLWLMLGTLYSLSITLYVLLAQPSLVIYNISLDEFYPTLSKTFEMLKVEPKWAGNTVALPELGIEMHVSSFGTMRNIRLSPVGDNQSLSGWRYLELALAETLKEVEVVPNKRGLGFLIVGVLMILCSTLAIFSDREMVVETIRTMFSG